MAEGQIIDAWALELAGGFCTADTVEGRTTAELADIFTAMFRPVAPEDEVTCAYTFS